MDKSFIHLEPTSTASWKSLVNEAVAKTNQNLNEDLESYLIFLLIRFTKNADLANSILALEYLESQTLTGQQQQQQLRDVGDKCLLFGGFYPEQAHQRLVTLEYFVNLGQSAYHQIANTHLNNSNLSDLKDLFNELSRNFLNLLDILNQIKSLNSNDNLVLDKILEYEKSQMMFKQTIITPKKPGFH